MKKILILTIFIFATLCGSVYAFSDVDPDSELGASVEALTEYGVINGYSDNTFRPDKEITRAEMCKMINVLFNFTDVGVNDFLDVSYNDWFYTQVLIANEYEYIQGFEDMTFKGNNNITREQTAVIICRITPLLEIEDTVVIKDEVSDWAKESVGMIANHKLLKTDDNGNFRAKENITRGELAMLLVRFIPKAKTDSYEKGEWGTNAEIAIENAVILANLKAAVRDIKSVEFNPNEQGIIALSLKGLEGTIEAGMKGNIVNKNYVVRNYGKEIGAARNIYYAMTDTEKGYFHANLVKLNNSTLIFLQAYFLGDKSPI